ncbi:MAG TPA: MotA/TolQ/ExbB proton channel family protein [Candidatus Polarisedimenticolia bacterium]|nr:MotA/TolQ/ExbB proton channel family protein [Candidatus Polarisedimenticolia bacterium]
MRATPAVLLLMVASLPAAAEEQAAAPSLHEVAAAAERDLEASLKDLAALRESIARERAPLAAELARLEDRLAGLRRRSESASREADTGNLELASLESENKLRRDELVYIGTLLDEFRAGFESKLNVGEQERYEAVTASARGASSDPALPQAEKLAVQLAVVHTAMARLQEAAGGERFEGRAVDPQGRLAEGRFALIGPVALFASSDGQAAGLAMPQTGSTRPAVRPLEAALASHVAAVVRTGTGILPVDATRGAALKDLVQRASLLHLFERGGPIMWPLLFASILALGTVIERLVFLFQEGRRRDGHAVQRMLDGVETGDMEGAVAAGRRSKDFVCRALTDALEHREKSISNALVLAQSLELKRFKRGIPILDTVITLAPLLGLLGTVTGMMNSFALIGGDLNAPSAITGGIAEALIATAFGLGIAITALIPFNYLNSRVEEARHELDAASTRLELLLHQPREAAPVHRQPEPVLAGIR